jgi:hypothetical protein
VIGRLNQAPVHLRVKADPLCAKRAQRDSRGIALPILYPSARRGWVVGTTPQPLCPWERDPAPIVQEVGGVLGLVRMIPENLTSPGLELQTPQPLASH